MFWLTDVGQSKCEPPVPCVLTVSAFCLLWDSYCSQQMVLLAFQPATSSGTVCTEDSYIMASHVILTIFSKIFRVKAYCHLLTALSSIITRKLNLWLYNSLQMLLDTVHLYRVYRLLITLSLLILWTLGHGYLAKDRAQTQNFNKNINCLPNEDVFIEIANTLIQAIFQYFQILNTISIVFYISQFHFVSHYINIIITATLTDFNNQLDHMILTKESTMNALV